MFITFVIVQRKQTKQKGKEMQTVKEYIDEVMDTVFDCITEKEKENWSSLESQLRAELNNDLSEEKNNDGLPPACELAMALCSAKKLQERCGA